MEVDESHYHPYTLTVKKIDPEFRPSINHYFKIKFNFFFKFRTFHWIRTQDSSISIDEGLSFRSIALASVTTRDHRSLSYDAIREAVGGAIAGHLPGEYLREIIGRACLEVDRILRAETLPKHGNLLLDFNIRIDHHTNMVPAESSVGLLEEVSEADDRESCCCICMEDFGDDGDDGGGGALRMPCLHVFHGDCIKKWLKTSHYCPVCRYEMPTDKI